ncbi:MAG: KpsF/GutQ family sugar-phosphate isomerase [Alphaproteobacteria bacterium]|nr:KpsF/GutQ family sugar-phosphate isomerase [Alphaproteobacteria bacterium]
MTNVRAKSESARGPADTADLSAAARVLRLEADGIKALAERLDGAFIDAVALLSAVKGRIIVTGVGKSGHIARKIAATFASTGSPAYFVHPTEASHGDLGMITVEDAVIALSNSGETVEIRDLLAYSRRFSIPTVAITGHADSTLAEMVDVVLLLPDVPEACPMGLAPTTSTTASLAMGDALAVALLERKGFSARDFQVLHPGGRLGSSLLRVSDLMHGGAEIPLAGPETPMSEAILVMTEKRKGCVGIIDGDGALCGVITDGDLRRRMNDDLLALTASAVMTPGPRTIRAQALAAEAVAVMSEHEITNLFVVDEAAGGGVPVGILHMHDCLKAGVV